MSPVSRRCVLTGAALTAASLIVPIGGRAAESEYEITDWIAIAPSGEVTLGLSQPEVGQGSYTALPQILADELDADWQRVKVRFVTGKAAYKIAFRQEPPAQKEGASMSTTALFGRLRIAGARPATCSFARRRSNGTSMLLSAAARTASSSMRAASGSRTENSPQRPPSCRSAATLR